MPARTPRTSSKRFSSRTGDAARRHGRLRARRSTSRTASTTRRTRSPRRVSTRALSPRMAVLVAAIANFAGVFVTTAVATTIGKGIIDTGLATPQTVLAALLGAIVWNLLTWWQGLPSSSSHALVGGLVGAALAQSGEKGVQWHGLVHKVVAAGALVADAARSCWRFVFLLAHLLGLPAADARVREPVVPARAARDAAPGSRSRTARTTRRRRWA